MAGRGRSQAPQGGTARKIRHPTERETHGAIDFDAALEGYACGYDDPEVLLRSAGLVLGSTIPLDEEHARQSPG
jgi:hypothetical protein